MEIYDHFGLIKGSPDIQSQFQTNIETSIYRRTRLLINDFQRYVSLRAVSRLARTDARMGRVDQGYEVQNRTYSLTEGCFLMARPGVLFVGRLLRK